MSATQRKRQQHKRKYGNNWYGKKGKRVRFVRELCIKQNRLCKICNDFMEFPTLDHIIPIAEGGHNIMENMQLLCESCHRFKDYHTNVKFSKINHDNMVRLKNEKEIQPENISSPETIVGLSEGVHKSKIREYMLHMWQNWVSRF